MKLRNAEQIKSKLQDCRTDENEKFRTLEQMEFRTAGLWSW